MFSEKSVSHWAEVVSKWAEQPSAWSEAEIDDVIVHNPQAVLTFEEPEAAQVGPNPTAGSSLARM